MSEWWGQAVEVGLPIEVDLSYHKRALWLLHCVHWAFKLPVGTNELVRMCVKFNIFSFPLIDECGIVAQVSAPLAKATISTYYICTYNTDHTLVSQVD